MSSSGSVLLTKIIRPYISLETPILPNDKLYPTPSMNDGLSYEDEFDLRITGCELIQTSGRLLKLPQTAMATGQIIFHRYYYIKSFVKNNMEYYAMAAIYLSSKIEESPRTIRDVINVFNNIKQIRGGKIVKPVPIDHAYYELKNQIIKAERRILKELGFCVHVKHPHKIILIYLSAMSCSDRVLVQKAWNYMNDSLRTDVFLRYTPETIACGCIYLSARELKIPLPTNPQWFTIFGADEDSLKSISVRLLHLYSHKAKTQEELEKVVKSCRDSLDKEKIRNREILHAQNPSFTHIEDSKGSPAIVDIKTASNTPTSDISAPSTTATTNGASNVINKINIINNTSINITNNNSSTTTSHHHHHHHNQQQQHFQYHQSYSFQQSNKNYQMEYLNEYAENNEPFSRYGSEDTRRSRELTSGRANSKSSSHKKHSRRYSRSHSRSRSGSQRSPPSTSPKNKRHKKRSSKERYRSKSRSRSYSPAGSSQRHKDKKKKYHHKSKSRGDDDYSYDSRYKNVLV